MISYIIYKNNLIHAILLLWYEFIIFKSRIFIIWSIQDGYWNLSEISMHLWRTLQAASCIAIHYAIPFWVRYHMSLQKLHCFEGYLPSDDEVHLHHRESQKKLCGKGFFLFRDIISFSAFFHYTKIRIFQYNMNLRYKNIRYTTKQKVLSRKIKYLKIHNLGDWRIIVKEKSVYIYDYL